MLVNYLYCLYKITFMLESEKRVEWKALHLYAFRIMLWISIISCTTFSLLNLPTFTGQKPQLMLLLACAHWEFPNIVKVWYFASRRAMLAFFILADGQRWATIVFDPLERNDTEQIYRWEVRTGKIMESLEHKTGQSSNSQKNSSARSQRKTDWGIDCLYQQLSKRRKRKKKKIQDICRYIWSANKAALTYGTILNKVYVDSILH